ncbi:MAG: hypothetical protein R2684_10795 [Pyrinomonadaceae bacterium]
MIDSFRPSLKYALRIPLIVLVLLAGLLQFGCTPQKIQTVSDETVANEILNVLLSYGLNASKQETGEGEKKAWEIMVSGGDAEYKAAIQLMSDHCLPPPMPPQVESTGIVSSLEVDKENELRRNKINLESQLRSIPGATCVKVNIVPPESRSLALDPHAATATVSVYYKSDAFSLTPNQIARMVAGGVPGLSADNVFVALTRKPIRPLPNIDRSRNIRRIIWVSAIGLVAVLGFVGFALFLRKRGSAGIEAGYETAGFDDGDTEPIGELPEGEDQ